MYIPHFVHSSVDGHLGHFCSGVFMNNAAINIHVCVFMYHVTFVAHLGSDGKFLFYILRNCQLFSKVVAPFYITPALRIPGTEKPGWAAVSGVSQSRARLKRLSSSSSSTVYEGSRFSTALLTLIIGSSHPTGYKVVAHCDAIQPSHPLSPLALNLSQHQGLFQ